MAKGNGWKMAIGAGSISSRNDWESAVMAKAGWDIHYCPVSGRKQVSHNGAVWCWDGWAFWTREDGHVIVSPRVHIFKAALEAFAKKEGVKASEVEWTIALRDGSDSVIAVMEPGRRTGYLWWFETGIGMLTKAEDLPPLPEGLHLVYPEWWPHEELEAYDQKAEAKAEAQIKKYRAEASQLGLKIGRGDSFCPTKYSGYYCPVCGRSEAFCPGAKKKSLYAPERPCEHQGDSPLELADSWQQLVEGYRAFLAKDEAKKQSKAKAQAEFEARLAREGFFSGRRDGCTLPDGWVVFKRMSAGSKANPTIWAFGPKLKVSQFKAFVAAVGDFSEVRMQGKFPVLYTKNPGIWIGKGGCYAKAFAKALGIRFLKIEKMN